MEGLLHIFNSWWLHCIRAVKRKIDSTRLSKYEISNLGQYGNNNDDEVGNRLIEFG